MRMHAKDNKGVLFFETILSFKQQRHTYIEAVPLPFDQFQDAPAYFRVSPSISGMSGSRLIGVRNQSWLPSLNGRNIRNSLISVPDLEDFDGHLSPTCHILWYNGTTKAKRGMDTSSRVWRLVEMKMLQDKWMKVIKVAASFQSEPPPHPLIYLPGTT